MVDARHARELADAQAHRLAPRGLAPEFLAEAIWHRTLAVGQPPDDAEVVEYLARCAADRVPVSGRQEHEQAIHPVERYEAPGVVIELEQQGRGRWIAWYRVRDGRLTSTRERECLRTDGEVSTVPRYHRTVSRIRRAVDERHPGGAWSYVLATRDRAEILRRWGREE